MDSPPAQPEPPRLPELRRQRELVARHLAWLDQEIADAAGPAPTPSLPPTPAAPAVAKTPPAVIVAATLPLDTVVPIVVPTPAPTQAKPTDWVTRSPFPEPESGLSRRDKWGCIIIVIIIGALILGSIWILPYFLHRE